MPMQPIDQAVVLVGGFGTRLGALTDATPKPLLEVAGVPFVHHVLRAVAAAGVADILLLAGHLGDQVAATFDGQRLGGARIRVRVEPAPLGTAGGLRHFAGDLADRFFVLNGDSYFDFDLNRLAATLSGGGSGDGGGGATAVVALKAMADCRRYGRVVTEPAAADGRVTAFLEKDPTADGPGLINAGVYAFDRTVIGLIPPGGASMEQHVLPVLAAAGRLQAVVGDGYFIDIGIPDALAAARVDLPRRLRRPAVFFDRDGVLNHDSGYTHRIADLRLIDGAVAAVRRCNAAGRWVFVVTNQAGVARGLYDEAAVHAFHGALQRALRSAGAHVDAFYHCPHHPGGTVAGYARDCDCRKPKPGMIEQALREWPVERAASVLIGDRPSDIDAARAAGIRGLLFSGGDLDAFCRHMGVS